MPRDDGPIDPGSPPPVATPCVVEELARDTPLEGRLASLRALRDHVMLPTAAGRAYVEDLRRHAPELLAVFDADPELRRSVTRCVGAMLDALEGAGPSPGALSDEVIAQARDLITGLGHGASAALAATLERLQHDLASLQRRRRGASRTTPR